MDMFMKLLDQFYLVNVASFIEPKVCKHCGETLSYSNTVSPEGWEEYSISGLCEKCFDDTTFCMKDGLDELNQDVLSIVENGVVMGGGALRSLVDYNDTPQDYDLFFTDTSKIEQTKNYFLQKGYSKVFECQKGELTTFKNVDTKVQLINKRDYSSCLDIISSFDITACCAAYDGEQFYKHNRFVFDNLNKLINLNTIEYPMATMKRIAKYSQKGFRLTTQATEYFVTYCNQVELTDDNKVFYID